MNKISVLIIILAVLTSCAPKYIIPENKALTIELTKIREIVPQCYEISPTGEILFKGGYISWNEKGLTVFIKK